MDKIFSLEKEKQNNVLKLFVKNIQEKHIQFYSFESNLQNIFSTLKIAGEIEKTDSDYFYYVNSNIGGLKTNDKIKESIKHYIEPTNDNMILHEVKLTRKHNGSYEWPSGINYSYIRFYLPKGSEVLEVKNFEKSDAIRRDAVTGMIYLEERSDKYPGKATVSDLDIYEENGKLVVGTWQVIKPGEELNSMIKYKSPIALSTPEYKLLIQKQAGISSQETTVFLKYNGQEFNKKTELFKDEEISIKID